MRNDPIEMRPAAARAHRRYAGPSRRLGERSANEPRVVDEVFARFDLSESSGCGAAGDRRLMRQALVTDLAAQLEALDQQRARLSQLLQSIEASTIG